MIGRTAKTNADKLAACLMLSDIRLYKTLTKHCSCRTLSAWILKSPRCKSCRKCPSQARQKRPPAFLRQSKTIPRFAMVAW